MVEYTRQNVFIKSLGQLEDKALGSLLSQSADTLETCLEDFTIGSGLLDSRFGRGPSPAKQQERERLYQKAAGAMAPIKSALDTLERAMQKTELTLFDPAARRSLAKGVDPADARAIEAETRALLREKSDIERRMIYLDAARAGNVEVIRAVELAPSIGQLVPEDVLKEGAALYAEGKHPQAFALLQEQQLVRSTINSDLNRAVGTLNKAAGVVPEPAVTAGAA